MKLEVCILTNINIFHQTAEGGKFSYYKLTIIQVWSNFRNLFHYHPSIHTSVNTSWQTRGTLEAWVTVQLGDNTPKFIFNDLSESESNLFSFFLHLFYLIFSIFYFDIGSTGEPDTPGQAAGITIFLISFFYFFFF